VDSRGSSPESPASSRGKRKWLLTGTMLLLGIFIGMLLGRALPSDSANPRPTPSEERDPDAQDELGVRLGYEPTQAGAVAAATSFSRVMTGPTDDPDRYRTAMAMIAAPQWRARAVQLADNAIEFVSDRYGEGGTVAFHPVRYRVVSHSSTEAKVELWGVVLASGPNIGGVEESWITAEITLHWVEGDWRVAGQSSEGGPTPELLRTEGGPQIESVLNRFKEYESGPEP
jgi:hypothetical protein